MKLSKNAGYDKLGIGKIYDFPALKIWLKNFLTKLEQVYRLTYDALADKPYGDIYSDTSNDIVCTVQNTWYQISFDVAGISNLTTVSIANDEITILKTGTYLVTVNISKHSHAANDFEYGFFKNNGATQFANLKMFETTLAGGELTGSSMTGLVALAAGDTMEIWVRCLDAAGKTISIDHCDLNILFIGEKE